MFAVILKHDSFKKHVVQLQSVRYKRVNLRKLRPPHYEAQKIQELTKIILPKPYDVDFPEFLKCRKPLKSVFASKGKENPYERILANELLELFEKSEMIIFMHQNPVSGEDFYRSIKTFKKSNMSLVQRSRNTVSMALENTKYLPVTSIFHSHTLMLFCETVQVDTVFKLLKKMPYYILLGGIINDKFLHRNKLEEYGKLPNLDIARGQLVHTLNGVCTELIQHLLHGSTNLTSLLNNLSSSSSSSSSNTKS